MDLNIERCKNVKNVHNMQKYIKYRKWSTCYNQHTAVITIFNLNFYSDFTCLIVFIKI